MATKPSVYPQFAVNSDGTASAAEIDEPSAAKKQLGWIKEQPSHETFNWLHSQYARWTMWFDEAIAANEAQIAQNTSDIAANAFAIANFGTSGTCIMSFQLGSGTPVNVTMRWFAASKIVNVVIVESVTFTGLGTVSPRLTTISYVSGDLPPFWTNLDDSSIFYMYDQNNLVDMPCRISGSLPSKRFSQRINGSWDYYFPDDAVMSTDGMGGNIAMSWVGF